MTATKAGDRIRLDYMPTDPDPLPPGAMGTVRKVANEGTDYEQIWVDWDPPNDHRSLMLLPGIDRYSVVTP